MNIPTIVSTANPALSAQLDLAINNKTKPLGSLGRLESLAKQIGLIQQTAQPRIGNPSIIVFAGDHGVVAENISAFPQSVTWQMVENFLAGGAAINVFARQNGCALRIVDAGVNHDFGVRDGLLDRKVMHGTRNFAKEEAMSAAQCAQAMQYGADLIKDLVAGSIADSAAVSSCNTIGFGEMGIGNTTAGAAIMHAITGLPAAQCVGAGTGLAKEGVAHKEAVVRAAVAFHAVNDPLAILAALGGCEIAMMVGAMLTAAERRMVILIDGFIVTSALLLAVRLQPAVLDYCVFTHCSDEQGHRKMLAYLAARPLLQMDLRLGEGTGSALALPLVEAAVNFLNQMATFESAAVSQQGT